MNVKPQALYLQTTTPFLPPRSASHSIAGRRASLRRSVPSPPLPFLRRSSLRLSRNPTREVASEVVGGVRFDGPVVEIGEISEVLDGDLAVEICITRALPPAVTLEQGIGRIREAVETLKLDPPSSSSGFLRFQVAVPPSAKALNWFCSQPDSSLVFPLFFVSKDTNEPSCKSLLLNETRGVFGIGASVYFERDSCSALGEMAQSKRYLSSESTPVLAYGFVDSSFDKELSVIKHEAGSYYFFIPQIELDECQGFSVLSATLVWCDSCLLTFEKAFHSFELSLVQATSHFWSTAEKCCTRNIVSSLRKLNLVEDGIIPKVYMRALSQGRMYAVDGIKEMREAPSSRQFCLRLSPTVVVASNMLNPTTGVGFSVQHCANINAVWASLIIEECFRLGLTYFCVAPGSRSSPLTVAASTHPLITCIVCFDERSLAFHAVGYARGSRKPAVVITSSGTAVSNLLPAVVEAYQDFVPLLLLTADRPPELLDAGANQAIDQGKHFGSFVRFFFSLPAPTDCIPARMVLTTIDSAVHWASFAPGGPVHVNCPFREPLENSPCKWTPSCLQGLDFWMSSAEPFTKYFDVNGAPCDDNPNEISEVINLMQQVSKGILLIGEIRTVDEIWALLLLAKHLSWPVVADILSGLRLRKIWTSFPDAQDHITFIDHLDHALVSDLVRDWTNADVIIQIGSRMTSKRVSKMLEGCFPCSYIMVDNHPFRYDPSHIVTHRIQSSIITFANYLLKFEFSHKKNGWSIGLQAVNLMVARELSFQIFSENSLTEPQVANIVSEALSSQSALFIGNSMPIRDADMYGSGWSRCIHKTSAVISNLELFAHLIWIVGNRGASGIDGLVSTAVGFAVGCNKRVICVVGDISFLHDTNGLAILSQRVSRKPMTIVVINNHGGAIFSLLPIAERIEESILNKYFCTSHNISIRGLCMAHGVKHLEIQTKAELNDALFMSQPEEMDFVIEVVSSIEANATFHSTLRKFACQAADHTLRFFLRLPVKDSVPNGFSSCKVQSIKYLTFRIPLCAPPTMTTVDFKSTSFYREGFILSLSLEDGCVGFGEVSPLDISKENLIDVEEQLRFLLHKMNGVEISCLLPLLKGSFSSWIWTNLGILPVSLFPSVRCGLEMAILNALAARLGVDLLSLLCVQKGEEALPGASSKVKVCALVDSDGTPTEVADIVAKLVEEGFTAIKLKVARCRSPTQDAEVMHEVRKMVGHRIELRVDANRNWTYEEAIRFGSFVKDCGLQYIEEPVKDEGDIIKFCEETGLPVALDETIDNIQENLLNTLMKYTHQGIVAVVIKPSVVGGFENAALIAQWAQQHGKMAVISSTFESGLGLAAYIHLSCYLDQKNAEICKLMNKEMGPSVAHGLGTYSWLKEDVATTRLEICRNQYSGVIEVSTSNANKLLQSFQINHNTICGDHLGEEVRRYQVPVYLDGIHYQIKVQEMGQESHGNVIVFLHGFLGTSEDWTSIMKAVSRGERCISIDLPGHGDTQIQKHGDKDVILEPSLSIEVVADIVYEVIHSITQDMITIVGYSMGARIALYMALRFTDKVNGAVVISGSPGMKDEVARKVRRATDDSRAQLLVSYGLGFFLDTWYSGKLWNSLRDHPKFNQIVRSRLHHHQDIPNLAKVLSDSSIGRQLPLWDDLKHCKTPLLIITGDRDEKFKRIAQDMCYAIDGAVMSSDGIYETVKIPNCGHAVHIENPLPVIRALRRFLSRLETSSNAFVGQLKN